jgi:phenylalanyl-tRNA synthetase beta chain
MRISLNWLREIVEFDLSPEDLADKLTMAGFEVEAIEDRRTWANGVVVGKILTAERHPNADKLQICTVDIGAEEKLNIVCGAPNARAGLFVPVATIGTYLPIIDLKLRPTKLRGERSEGMICSLAELGLTKDSSGIHEFEGKPPLGSDVRPLLALDDVVLDVSSTANRADALSMVGIAREVAALTGGKLTLPVAELVGDQPQKSDWVSIAETKACSAYIGTLVKSVKVERSPEWLQRRLQAAGMRPINNIVDITNYVLLEWGQPLHAFDADKLAAGLQIGVRFAATDEKLATLDGQERGLQTQNLLITSGDRPVAIAGVMGGQKSEVSDLTTNIVLEAALFDQAVTRRSARAQALRTEASARYERGVNQAALETACTKALRLIQDLAGGLVSESSKVDHRPELTRTIVLRLDRVHQILGTIDADDDTVQDLPATTVETTLRSLAFELTAIPATDKDPEEISWSVTVPPFRYADIEREIDLIEEVARIYGYDKFCETLPARTELGYLPPDQILLRQVRESLRGVGLTEIIQMSLCSPTNSNQVTITNPIATEYSALRSDLLTGLIDAYVYNLSQGNGDLNGFEIGRVFWNDEDGIVEADNLAGIFGGDFTVGLWQHNTKPLNWYEAKGLLDTVFQRLGLIVEYQPDQKDDRLHPGRTASLWISGERLGTFGQLHPQLRSQKELPDEVYAFELDLYVLLDAMNRKAIQIFQPFSSYPKSDRDLAFFVPNKVTVAELQRAITHAGGELLESVTLFDQYLGTGVPEGQRSLAFRLVYRASDRTLMDTDVNPVHQKVREMLEEKFRVSLRS